MDYSPSNSPDQNTGVGSCSHSPGDRPNTGIKPRSPALQADSFIYLFIYLFVFLKLFLLLLLQVDSLPAEPQGRPKNTGVGSLLQQIPSPADLPNPGIELVSPASQADSLSAELLGKPLYE